MPGPNSPSEKTFRFIDDPGHKENLSGRVRAACMTCRRKKIKCSGELNCRTCRERGIVCEGLPERRRPRRDSTNTITKDMVTAEAKKRKAEELSSTVTTSKKLKIRQDTASPKAQDSPKDDSAPLAMVQQERKERFLSPSLSAPEPPSVNVKITYKHSSKPSRAFHVDSWQLQDERPSSQSPKPHNGSGQHLRIDHLDQDDILSGVPLESVRPAEHPINWPGVHDPGSIWHSALPEQPPNLEAGNRALNTSTYDPMSRRQSIAFPLPLPDGALEQQRDPFAGGGGAYDDIATLLYTRTGMTPGMNEVSGWLDIDPDLARLLAQSSNQSVAMSNVGLQTEPILQQDSQPQGLSDVFGQWPNWPNE